MSDETSVSLLDRLRHQPDAGAWARLVELYTPLIRTWLGRYDLQASDAEDLVQEVLGVVVRELPRFEHNQKPGAFRAWLRSITVHRLRDFWRSRQTHPLKTGMSAWEKQLAQLEDASSDLSRQWDREHDRYVVGRLLAMIEAEFEPTSWRAFRRVVLDGARASEAATELGISPNAVCIAKSRVLSRLRQEGAGLID
jgi:RNA polymerase sigma-70 factor, ECF subfamily